MTYTLKLLVFCNIIILSDAQAAIVNVGPGDSFTKIESAQAGDEVVIAPGTYAFRVYLAHQATASNPIVIRALNPANPPVWDFGTNLVENAPGSYGAGDRGRGGWQFSGARNYRVSGIVFRNCRTSSANSAGIRYYSGTTNLYLKDCLFVQNDNGLTGGSQDSEVTVEHCEFDSNGNTNASLSAPTHNMYIYGGIFTMRYSYLHDSAQSQNFHIRARLATIEYNWFARAKAYEGDLMTDDDFTGIGPFTQTMILRGNIFVQHSAPANHGQVIAMYNDAGLANLTLTVRALYNTFIGNGGSAAFVHVSNADATRMNLEESDNLIYGTTRPYLVENSGAASVTGVNNWLPANATVGTLTGSVQSPAPGFRDPAQADFTLAPTSVCVGAANASIYGLPGREYFRNELTNRQWRVRAAARDIGAFESTTTSTPVGPYDPIPLPSLSVTRSGATVQVAWPLFAGDFQPERSVSLNPAIWTLAALSPATNAAGLLVTFPPTGTPAFFRLKK